MSSPQPGWYPDPYSSAHIRYWDGEKWTQDFRLADAAVAVAEGEDDSPGHTPIPAPPEGEGDPLELPPPADPFATAQSSGARSGAKVLPLAAGVAVLAAAGAVLFAAQNAPEPEFDDREVRPAASPLGSGTQDLPDVVGPLSTRLAFDVPAQWRDATAATLPHIDASIVDAFVGSWNVDGLPDHRTSAYAYFWEFPDPDWEADQIVEVAAEYYSYPFEGLVILTDSSDTYTTPEGHAGWHRTVTGMDGEFSVVVVHHLIHTGSNELALTLYDYSLDGDYAVGLWPAIDSLREIDS